METFVFDTQLAPALLGALWMAAVLAVGLYIFWRPTRLPLVKRLWLGVLHFVPLAGVLVLLHHPSYVVMAGSGGSKPALSVYVDSSASMAAEDSGTTTRFAQATQAIQAALPNWSKDFDVRLRTFDGTVRPAAALKELQETPPNGAVTDLAAPVQAAVEENPRPALALLFSDGIHNARSDVPAAARTARAAGLPVFTCALGSDVTVRDLGVVLASGEELAFVGQKIRVPVTITQLGFDNSEVGVELRLDGKVREKKSVRFARETELQTEFVLAHDAPGLYGYEIAVPPQKGESVTANNSRRLSVRVVSERIAILFIEGKPYWDSKFLVRVLRRDPNVAVTTALRLRGDKVLYEPPEETSAAKPAAAGALPANPTKPLEDAAYLASFQVVMLGRDTDEFLSAPAVENLRAWVAGSGGHLVCTRGRPVSETNLSPALAALLPVAWRNDEEKHLRVKLTERGRALALFEAALAAKPDTPSPESDSGIVVKSLPSLVTATSIEKERTLAVVLARGETDGGTPMAVLSVQNYGTGKTVVMEGQGMWRWGFRAPDDALHGEDVFRAFWSNTIRWLAGSNEFLPSQSVVLKAGKPLYQAGEKPILYVLRREMKGARPDDPVATAKSFPLEVLHSDGGKTALSNSLVALPVPRENNLFQVELEALEAGSYTARLNGVSPAVETAFEILAPLKERLDLRARPDQLEELSRSTDGKLLTLADLGDIRTFFREYVRQHKPGSEIKRPAWDSVWVLSLFLIWFGAAWWTRRRWGVI